ncbi:hypothetical protein GCM10010885_02450 [Alicyclobacillus cellulosilyticus]|uniref:Uncharacterized protein n=1 Tax=Alicyclobacillus cellulosilyticus TaxID=1003997 RepID=A0A917K3Y9_9BACL|nr:hypothetical protein GCM10010885_02450 [Alicyclobacillus cellulosilyticus]
MPSPREGGLRLKAAPKVRLNVALEQPDGRIRPVIGVECPWVTWEVRWYRGDLPS